MPDYAGAVAAIKARLAANWATTPVAYQNEEPPETIVDGVPVPWVYCEITNNNSELHAAGKPGSLFWIYDGLIELSVFVPIGSGIATALQYAVALGEIFRAQTFYNETSPHLVRCWSPRVDGGESGADDGNWFRVTCTVPFEYWHRG